MPECSKCGHHNPDEVKSCLKCAGELILSCPTCGQPAVNGSKFCIQCGMRLPDRAFRPLDSRAKPGQVRSLPGTQVPMVGREDALRQLGDTLDRVLQDGHSRITLITGEAGVGKSRLVAEFRQAVDQSRAGFFQGGPTTYARLKPLWLAANLLRNVLGLSETDPSQSQVTTLQAYLDQLGLGDDSVFPCLCNVLGLAGEDTANQARLSRLDNAMLQRLTHAALREVLLAEARHTPSVLVFEDLHWVDPASRDFLEYLIQSVDDVPVMLVLVSRDVERDKVLKPLITAAEKRRYPLVDIKLNLLTPGEGYMLVDRLIEGSSEAVATLRRRVVERSGGNPFYAQEIVRILAEQGGLRGENGSWQVMPRASELVERVPQTLNGLIVARFHGLSKDLRDALQKAAVIGPSFPASLVARLNGYQRRAITAQLNALEARGFLVASPLGEEMGYAFPNSLVQEVVYGTLTEHDRQKLHERIGRLIEGRADWPLDERTETIAYHYVRSADVSLAVPYLIAAGENAARRCAYESAIQHYRQALAHMPEGDNFYGQQRAQVQIGLGQALKFVGEFREAAEILEKALQPLLRQSPGVDSISLLSMLVQSFRELADIRLREGSPDEAVAYLRAGLDAVGDERAQTHPQLWRTLIDRLAWVRFRQGKLDEAFTLASSATLDLAAESPDDPVTLASLYNTLGSILWQRGDLSAAANCAERVLESYQSVGYAWGVANAYTNLGALHFAQGLWPRAVEYYQQAYRVRRDNGYLPGQALNLNNLGVVHTGRGNHDQARQHLEAGLAVSQRLGEDYGIALAQVGLGHLAVVQSRFEEAATHIRAALRLSYAAGEDLIAQARWLWALVQAERGDLLAGRDSAELALGMAHETGLT